MVSKEDLHSYRTFADKAARGEPITIVYFGGSITAGAATYPLSGTNREGLPYGYAYDIDRDSWRGLTFDWLRKSFETRPGQFREVNAAFGGSGSVPGAFRFDEHVLPYEPDLLFIEFAVNDNGIGMLTRNDPYADLSIFRTYMSIVSRARRQNPHVALFSPISTYRPNACFGDERFDVAAAATVKAANLFAIPYVRIRDVFYKDRLPSNLVRDRLFDGEDIAGNAVHPSPPGHRAYAEGVIAALKTLFRDFAFEFGRTPLPGLSPYPVNSLLLKAGNLAAHATGWILEPLPEREGHPIVREWQRIRTRDSRLAFALPFEGASIGVWFDRHVSNARVEIRIDGEKRGVWGYNSSGELTWAGQCETVATGLDPRLSHRLEIIPCEEQMLKDGLTYELGIIAIFIDLGKTKG